MTNPQHRRALRYAVGVTLAAALAFGIAWPLSFLFPVLSAVFLALPLPKLTLKQGLRNMRDTLFAFGVGFIFTQFILPFPVIYVPLLALALFHTYYHLNRGGSFWLVLMLLVCLLLMPMLAGLNEGLAIGVVSGLVGSSWLTICLLWVAHYIVPDAPGGPTMPQNVKDAHGYQPVYSWPAAELALKSTVVVLPIVIIFIANNWTSQILVMVFAAIFTLSPDLDKGKEAGMNSIKSTLIGGCVAFFVFWALVAVPEYYFLVLLMFITSLGFGAAINSGKPIAKYLPSAMVAMIILVNSSLGEGADFSENFVLRVLFVSMASIYVVTALKVLNAFWPQPALAETVSS
ncbi:MAG: DUF2955 domain-containing protein [Gammaproteobacteria bacterium]|nr:DUF2955 domain-containing protein [Gammaproteobacteria bacterium]